MSKDAMDGAKERCNAVAKEMERTAKTEEEKAEKRKQYQEPCRPYARYGPVGRRSGR